MLTNLQFVLQHPLPVIGAQRTESFLCSNDKVERYSASSSRLTIQLAKRTERPITNPNLPQYILLRQKAPYMAIITTSAIIP